MIEVNINLDESSVSTVYNLLQVQRAEQGAVRRWLEKYVAELQIMTSAKWPHLILKRNRDLESLANLLNKTRHLMMADRGRLVSSLASALSTMNLHESTFDNYALAIEGSLRNLKKLTMLAHSTARGRNGRPINSAKHACVYASYRLFTQFRRDKPTTTLTGDFVRLCGALWQLTGGADAEELIKIIKRVLKKPVPLWVPPYDAEFRTEMG